MADPTSSTTEPPPFFDQMLAKLTELAAPMIAARDAGVPLPADELASMTDAYIATFRAAGWFQQVEPERLEELLDVVVVEYRGAPALDVETAVAGATLIVPGWGDTETDPAEVGRGIAEDEVELLEDARDAGEETGWE